MYRDRQRHAKALDFRLSETQKDLKREQQLNADRQAALKAKDDFIQQVKDEMTTLQLELTISKKQQLELQKINGQMEKRWLQHMEEERAKQVDK